MWSESEFVLLISCEHAANKVPKKYLEFMPKAELQKLTTHRGFDKGALEVAKIIARQFKVPLFYNEYSRLLVDSNRSFKNKSCLGLSFRNLSQAIQKDILDRYYWPHRSAIQDYVKTSILANKKVLHIAVHSFTPRLAGETRNADIAWLYDPRRESERHWVNRWCQSISTVAEDLRVRRNYPYKGTSDGLTTALRGIHGPQNYAGIELEINQKLLDKSLNTRKMAFHLVELLQLSFGSCARE